MIDAPPATSALRVVCRQIREADLPALIDLLQVGFPRRSRDYWVQGLRRLAAHVPPEKCPRFGYLLEAGGVPAGVLLTIFSASPDGTGPAIRGNVSSWYVRPEARAYASLLVLRALNPAAATFLNVSPAPGTLATIEAQGFTPFSAGVFAGLPMLVRGGAARLHAHAEQWRAMPMPEADRRLLLDHQAFGCIGIWCETAEGGLPFVFRRRHIKPGGIPCAQLIYCRSLEALQASAGPLGRFLAWRGMPLMLVATDRPLPGIAGRFYPQRQSMYFRGAMPPRAGDLSYTEAAIIGF
jgi:hypothetical protein